MLKTSPNSLLSRMETSSFLLRQHTLTHDVATSSKQSSEPHVLVSLQRRSRTSLNSHINRDERREIWDCFITRGTRADSTFRCELREGRKDYVHSPGYTHGSKTCLPMMLGTRLPMITGIHSPHNVYKGYLPCPLSMLYFTNLQ